MELSVLIPSRNEMFLDLTVKNVLANMEADTEIIVVLDGPTSHAPPPVHPRVKVIILNEPIGQRAATNLAANNSTAKYVMKLDAHCAVGPGFDRIMLEDMQQVGDTTTLVPTMYNLHAFDWVCQSCKHRMYQGPTPSACPLCGAVMQREIIWRPKKSPETTAMRFDENLKFAYWGAFKKRQTGELVETMSLLGACWLLTRERYWALAICDEEHGSWGQQGTEVACKTWLSGGKLLCTRRTWFAHMFRTQGGDFGFPYPLSQGEVEKARQYSLALFKQQQWGGAVRSLSWLLEHFKPVPGWHDSSGMSKGLIYYTDNQLDPVIMGAVQNQLYRVCQGFEVVSASLHPIDFGKNIVIAGERGPLTLFRQILASLEASTADIVYFVEHDCLYHKSCFDFIPEKDDIFYYNNNGWQVDYETGKALTRNWRALSGLCCYRSLALEHYRRRVQLVEQSGFSNKMGYEPGTHSRPERVDHYGCSSWHSEYPYLDIRHSNNWTQTRWSKEQFRNKVYTEGWQESDSIPGWGKVRGVFKELVLRRFQEGPYGMSQ